MKGKTHLAVGTAAAMVVMKPSGMQILAGGLAAAAFGSVISDIDAGTSGAGKDGAKAVAVTLILAAAVIFCDYFFKLDLYHTLIAQAEGNRAIPFAMALLVICAVGILTKHRSFMHSFFAMGLMGVCFYFISPALLPWFCIGFGSHLFLDLFNHKGEMLFFPWRERYSLGWMKSGGRADNLLFAAGIVVLIISLYNCRQLFPAPALPAWLSQ